MNDVDRIGKACLGKSQRKYEEVRQKIIKDKGYDNFRESQKEAFKKYIRKSM